MRRNTSAISFSCVILQRISSVLPTQWIHAGQLSLIGFTNSPSIISVYSAIYFISDYNILDHFLRHQLHVMYLFIPTYGAIFLRSADVPI